MPVSRVEPGSRGNILFQETYSKHAITVKYRVVKVKIGGQALVREYESNGNFYIYLSSCVLNTPTCKSRHLTQRQRRISN